MLGFVFEFMQAHDWQRTYDITAHLFFAGARMAPDFIDPQPGRDTDANRLAAQGGGIADQIAFLHLLQWPAGDKARMSAARPSHNHEFPSRGMAAVAGLALASAPTSPP